MNVHSYFLRCRFWVLDFLKGSPIGIPYREIKEFNNASYEKGQIQRDAKLKRLLEFAQTHTSFYHNFHSYKLADYPVINKRVLIEHHKELEVPKDKIPGQIGDVYIQKTSGSTGMPLEIPQDTLKRRRRIYVQSLEEEPGCRSHQHRWRLRPCVCCVSAD